MITKKLLAEDLSNEFGWTKKEANEALDFLFKKIVISVSEGSEVSINGFGKFEIVNRKERTCMNPFTGKKITIKESKAPKFKASKFFKDKVNNS